MKSTGIAKSPLTSTVSVNDVTGDKLCMVALTSAPTAPLPIT